MPLTARPPRPHGFGNIGGLDFRPRDFVEQPR